MSDDTTDMTDIFEDDGRDLEAEVTELRTELAEMRRDHAATRLRLQQNIIVANTGTRTIASLSTKQRVATATMTSRLTETIDQLNNNTQTLAARKESYTRALEGLNFVAGLLVAVIMLAVINVGFIAFPYVPWWQIVIAAITGVSVSTKYMK